MRRFALVLTLADGDGGVVLVERTFQVQNANPVVPDLGLSAAPSVTAAGDGET